LKIKNYILVFVSCAFFGVANAQFDSISQRGKLYLCASVGFVTPELSYGIEPGFFDNEHNNFGTTGYAEVGVGTHVCVTYLIDRSPFGLTSSLYYYHNNFSNANYVVQVNNFNRNHYKPMNSTGYTQAGIVGGITIAPSGKESWLDLKLLGGFVWTFTPLVADSGNSTFYSGNLQPSGPDILHPANTIIVTWGFGIEARPYITKKVLFLFNTEMLFSSPIFTTTETITYYDQVNNVYTTQTMPYRFSLNISTLYVSGGIAYKIGR
jgi:hypothetical protein